MIVNSLLSTKLKTDPIEYSANTSLEMISGETTLRHLACSLKVSKELKEITITKSFAFSSTYLCELMLNRPYATEAITNIHLGLH